jgi:hypothetical protein
MESLATRIVTEINQKVSLKFLTLCLSDLA